MDRTLWRQLARVFVFASQRYREGSPRASIDMLAHVLAKAAVL
jgi:hypothetical protein